MEKYLYGARIKGIQSFIFETGKLKEIAGASELVEEICKELFEKTITLAEFQEENLLLRAAGNIRYIFSDRKSCERFLLEFPKHVYELAPGINLSQAVVKLEGPLQPDHISLLEDRLEEAQNATFLPFNYGLMLAKRSGRTGRAIEKRPDVWEEGLDVRQNSKVKAFTPLKKEHSKQDHIFKQFLDPEEYSGAFPKKVEDLLGQEKKGWIAIVHADGNGLGKLLRGCTKKLEKEGSDQIDKFYRQFSLSLEKATQEAVRIAFENEINHVYQFEKNRDSTMASTETSTFLPFQPVILGGDDITFIVRGNLAIPFSQRFLKEFEKHTKEGFLPISKQFDLDQLQNGLTACAGIAFIKHNYPFHFGVDLSDELCKYAKKISRDLGKGRTPSSLMFHRVLSSFVESYHDIREKELKTHLTPKEKEVHFSYGPYFLSPPSDSYLSIHQLQVLAKRMKRGDSPKTAFEDWITELGINYEKAKLRMDRMIQINPNIEEYFHNKKASHRRIDGVCYTHLQDILTLSSII